MNLVKCLIFFVYTMALFGTKKAYLETNNKYAVTIIELWVQFKGNCSSLKDNNKSLW